MTPPDSVPATREVLAALSRPGPALAAAGAILLVDVAAFALWRVVNAGLPEPVTLGAFLGLSVPPLAAWALLARAGGLSARRALAASVGAHLTAGLGFLAAGIPGYLEPGFGPLVVFWPSYALWLHSCTLGAGLWPCPPG